MKNNPSVDIVMVNFNKGPYLEEAINSVCLNETSRAKFEVNARNVSNKYKALYPEEQVKQFTRHYNAIDAIYSGLNQEFKSADITELMKKLQE